MLLGLLSLGIRPGTEAEYEQMDQGTTRLKTAEEEKNPNRL